MENRKNVFFFLGSIIVVLFGYHFELAQLLQGRKNFSFELCNLNPYPVHYMVEASGKQNHGELSEVECRNINLKFKNYTAPSAKVIASAEFTPKFKHVHPRGTVKWEGKIFQSSFWQFSLFEKYRQTIVDPDLAHILPYDPKLSDEEVLGIAKSRALKISGAIEKQMDVRKHWQGREVPYFLGANTHDKNGLLVPGVILSGITPTTLFGDPSPYKHGDVLIAFNDQEVFSEEDLYFNLHIHATSRDGGIRKPYKFKIIRDDMVLEGRTTYLFNPKYWGYSETEKVDAAGYGFLNAATLGLAVEARCAAPNVLIGVSRVLAFTANTLTKIADLPNKEKAEYAQFHDYNECQWNATQYVSRLMQMYQETFDGAAWLTVITPSLPRLLLQQPIVASGLAIFGNRAVAGVATVIVLEALEMSIWTALDASPNTTIADKIDMIKEAAPIGAGIGLLAAIIS